MKTKTIYLAGAIRNKPNGNADQFAQYAKLLRAQGHLVFSPRESDLPDIRKALKQDFDWILDHATTVALMPGWEASRGARAEFAIANAVDDVEIIYLRESDLA